MTDKEEKLNQISLRMQETSDEIKKLREQIQKLKDEQTNLIISWKKESK